MQAMGSGCKYRWSFVHWPATHFLLCSPITIRPWSVVVHGLGVVDPALAGRESHFTSDELISKLASCHLQLWLSQSGPGHLCARQGLISFHGTCFYPQRKKESEVAQSCLTLCNLMDCSLPGCSVHGIFQARVLEWVAIAFSRGSSQARDQTWVSRISGRHFTVWATREGVSRQTEEGGWEDREAHGGEIFVQQNAAHRQWGWDWNPHQGDATASCSPQMSFRLTRAEADMGPCGSWSKSVLSCSSIVSYQFLQYFSR